MDSSNRQFLKSHIAPLIAACLMGLGFAVCSLIAQDGSARGYTSIGLLFVTAALAAIGLLAGIVALAMAKLGTAFELIGSSILLPATFLTVLFAIGILTGD